MKAIATFRVVAYPVELDRRHRLDTDPEVCADLITLCGAKPSAFPGMPAAAIHRESQDERRTLKNDDRRYPT